MIASHESHKKYANTIDRPRNDPEMTDPEIDRSGGTRSGQGHRHHVRVPRWVLLASIALVLTLWLIVSNSKVRKKRAYGIAPSQNGLAPIGTLNSIDPRRWNGVINFFSTNGVPCSIDGTVMYDILVRTQDEARAKALLELNGSPDEAFESKWERALDWPSIRRRVRKLLGLD